MKVVSFKLPSETEIKLVNIKKEDNGLDNSQTKLNNVNLSSGSNIQQINTPDQSNSHKIMFPNQSQNQPNNIQEINRQSTTVSQKNFEKTQSFISEENKLQKASIYKHSQTNSSNSVVFQRKDRKSFKNYTYIQQMLNKYISIEQKTYQGEEKLFTEKVERIDRVKGYNIKYPLLIIPMHSKFKACWDLLLLVLIVWMAIELPWEFAFPEDSMPVFNTIILVCYSLDILINLRTTYFNKDQEEIVSGFKCAIHYIQSFSFVIDVISSLPYDQISELKSFLGYQRLINMIKFTKITHLFNLNQVLRELFSEQIQLYTRLFKNFFLLLLILHWFSLLYLTLAISEVNIDQILNNQSFDSQSWVPSIYLQLKTSSQRDFICDKFGIYETTIEHNLDGSSQFQLMFNAMMQAKCATFTNFERYIFTYYSIVMLLLGGEVAPITKSQSQSCGIIAIIGQISLAIIFANMSMLIFKIQLLSAEQDAQRKDLKFRLEQLTLPSDIQQKVYHYFNYCWRKSLVYLPDLQHFQDLSKSLRLECLISINKHLIINIPLFEYFNDFQILSLVQMLKTKVFMPNDLVFDMQEVVSDLYYINEGVFELKYEVGQFTQAKQTQMHQQLIRKRTVSNFNQIDQENSCGNSSNQLRKQSSIKMMESTDNDDNYEKYTLTVGDHFAQYAILGNWQSNYSVKSILFSVVQTLSIADFNELKYLYPELQPKIKQGLKHYKEPMIKLQIDKWISTPIFKNLMITEIQNLMLNIMEDIFAEIGKIIIKPIEYINAMFFIVEGKVDVYQEVTNKNGKTFISEQELIIDYKNQDSVFFNCFDDQIEDVIDDLHKKMQNQFLYDKCVYLGSLEVGNYFGNIETNKQLLSHNKFYFVCKQPCHFLVLTKNVLNILQRQNKTLYQSFIENLNNRVDPIEKDQFLNEIDFGDKQENSLEQENNQTKGNVSINLINNQNSNNIGMDKNAQDGTKTQREQMQPELTLDQIISIEIMKIEDQEKIIRNIQTCIEIMTPQPVPVFD